MDGLSLLRMIGGLGLVLGALGAALWLVRRYDIRLPGRFAGSDERRVSLVERLPIDAKHSIVLVRRDAREHLLLLSPDGSVLLEAGIVGGGVQPSSRWPENPAPPSPFAALLRDGLPSPIARRRPTALTTNA